MPQPHTPLGEYVDELRRAQNLSWRKASYKCGLSPEALSMLVRRGKTSTPRPSTLRAIADGLGGNYERMMMLAGHLDAPTRGETPPEVQQLVNQIIDAYNAIKHDPQAVDLLIASVSVQTDALRVVAERDKQAERLESQIGLDVQNISTPQPLRRQPA